MGSDVLWHNEFFRTATTRFYLAARSSRAAYRRAHPYSLFPSCGLCCLRRSWSLHLHAGRQRRCPEQIVPIVPPIGDLPSRERRRCSWRNHWCHPEFFHCGRVLCCCLSGPNLANHRDLETISKLSERV